MSIFTVIFTFREQNVNAQKVRKKRKKNTTYSLVRCRSADALGCDIV